MRRPVVLGVVAALIGGLVLAELLSGHAKTAQARPAPALPHQILVGPRPTVAALRGRPAIVHFWASWCGPCTREARALATLPAALGARARVVGVDWNDALEGARLFIASHRWRFQNVRDGSGAAGDRYGLTGLPTTYVLDARGRIRQTLRGPQTHASIERALARLPG